MPVRSLTSSVLRWPDANEVDQAVRHWAAQVRRHRDDVVRIGYFGSYARGDWGVGSDLDLVIIVEHSLQPLERRAKDFDTTQLPVPADVLIYTTREWEVLAHHGRTGETLRRETIWA